MPFARLESRAVIAVTGPDARAFLHNLLTQKVEGLGPGEWRFGALLTPQGRLLFDLFLLGADDGVLLDCRAEQREALIRRLSMYRLRAAIEVAPDRRGVFAAWDAGAPEDWSVDPRLSGLGRRAIIDGASPSATEDDWRAWQHENGVPDAEDLRPDADYPIEANFDLLNGIDFQKGCFVGQETTSRMHRRGKAKTRLVPLVYEGAPPYPGAEVLSGVLRAGEVRSGAGGRAMALVRLDRLTDLTVEGRRATAEPPPWLPPLA